MSSAARPDPAEAPEERRFLSTAEAAALERELLEDYRFGRQQLVELCGHASAVAVTKAHAHPSCYSRPQFPHLNKEEFQTSCLCLCCAPCQVFPLHTLSRKQRTVLVVCGPEQNGAVGLVCARHLHMFEYEPTIFYPTRSLDLLHRDLTTQCEKMDIPFLSYLPTEVQLINDAYGLVVDAVLGPGVQPGEIGGPCMRALATLKLLSIPLAGTRRPAAATPRMGSAPTCWYRSPRPSAAPAASPAATTSWPAGSCPTTCAESSLCACRDTRAPTASRRCDRHPRPGGLDPRQ
ncbi:yjeF N-terminal domain-containing protein 3 isoform X1 [Ailuropoda melanoleuca]|uniref:yjeF N-terminal domain-containing protein 3 isoform X1 n=1 Tax=Ailuropoda melanoleuca TaxID=9646 RepID=UPI00149427F0|nr:yjeF N-terminal domain-containing protein 3 isoform X1 [Ailuropoda melanoleuca]